MTFVLWLPHTFPGNLFINSLCVHVVFKGMKKIHPELLLTVRVVRCLGIGNSRTRKALRQYFTIFLLERIDGTVICPIFFYINCRFIIQICCSLSSSKRERERERERVCEGLWTVTQRDTPSTRLTLTPTDDFSNCLQLKSIWLPLTKFANFYSFKFRTSLLWCRLTKLLRHLTSVPNSAPCFSFSRLNI